MKLIDNKINVVITKYNENLNRVSIMTNYNLNFRFDLF